MKTINEDGERLTIVEGNGTSAEGRPMGRSWTFTTFADAARQESEFAAELAAAPKDLRDKFTAAKLAAAPKLEAAPAAADEGLQG